MIKEKRDYRKMLEQGWSNVSDLVSRLAYLSEYIFKFTTYETTYSELFATKALEVCTAINDRKTFEYINNPEGHLWFLLMCNMPFFRSKLNWGTSIRSAFWSASPNENIELRSCGLWLDGKQLHETMEFTCEQWHEFIAAVLAFACEETTV